MLRSLGADQVIDYTQHDFTRNGKQYDLILDVVARRSMFDYQRALCPDGTLVVVGGSLSTIFQLPTLGRWVAKTGNKNMGLLLHKPDADDLKTMNEFFEAGHVVPVIDRRYGLHEAAEALRYLGAGHVRGKVILTVEHADTEG
jgi:NADPH:quinone reductase-like Zn-dependent oxidoreductase